ncbi:MAG: hypothetical protein OXG77_08180 [Chloroflexi bacterium]|nr:hypothetical protein [Chloroflexota bacterium]
MPPSADAAAESANLPQGDWYIVPPVEGEWKVEATPDGRGGQHLRMLYPDGYAATVYMRADGRLRVRLYRDNRPHPMEIDHDRLHIWFVDE